MELIIVLVIAAALITFAVIRSRSWQTLMAATANTAEELQAKYAYLKDNGVKCRLRTESDTDLGAMKGVDAGGNHVVKLDVHKKDIDRAANVLEQYEKEQQFA